VQNDRFRKKKATVLYYGIDLNPYTIPTQRDALRKEWGITANCKVLLYTGRMTSLKNPVFVVDILKELLTVTVTQDVVAVFVGKGELEEAVLERIKELGLTDKVRMLGWRNDIAEIMQAADVFVFPRVEYPKEGLGLVVVEAQAAGLRMVISRGIVEDAIEIDELTSIIPLANNSGEWAQAINKILHEPAVIDRATALERMQQSRFALPRATENLINLYENN
jgi:glycosyltransferase involved in cell wall biosynthesis